MIASIFSSIIYVVLNSLSIWLIGTMLGNIMSGEKITTARLSSTHVTQSLNAKASRININNLLSRVREEKNKEKKENYMFLGLVVGLFAVAGLIVSL